MLIGTFVKAARAILNMSQDEVANSFGDLINRQKVAAIESSSSICNEKPLVEAEIKRIFMAKGVCQTLSSKELHIYYKLNLAEHDIKILQILRRNRSPIIFAEYLRAARSILGINQKEFARNLAVGNKLIVALEKQDGLITDDPNLQARILDFFAEHNISYSLVNDEAILIKAHLSLSEEDQNVLEIEEKLSIMQKQFLDDNNDIEKDYKWLDERINATNKSELLKKIQKILEKDQDQKNKVKVSNQKLDNILKIVSSSIK